MTSNKATEPRSPALARRLVAGLAAVALVAGAGVAAHLSGYGWFGYRVLLYGHNQLYVLNLEDEPRRVIVDGRTTRDVQPDNAAIAPLVGGAASVRIETPEGEPIATRTVETDRTNVLYHLGGESCLVVTEVSNVDDGTDLTVEVVDMPGPQTELYHLDSRNIVWPRGYPGVLDETASDPPRSVEVLDCDLRDDEDFVTEYITQRLRARM